MASSPEVASRNHSQPPLGGSAHALMATIGVLALGLLALAGWFFQKNGYADTSTVVVPGWLGLGLLGLVGAYCFYVRHVTQEWKNVQARRAQFPAQPWRWKKEWLAPAIEAEVGLGVAALWKIAIPWNALSLWGAWSFLTDPQPKMVHYLILPILLVGLGLLVAAIHATAHWRKFGRIRFAPSTHPGVIGGDLSGLIQVPAPMNSVGAVRLLLQCVRREITGGGENSSAADNVLWKHEEQVARDQWITGPGGTEIPVRFSIPAECRGTDAGDGFNEILWQLSADAKMPGIDLTVQFVVPVFATGETAPPAKAG